MTTGRAVKTVRILLGVCCAAVLFGTSDLSPLWLYEPYLSWLRVVTNHSPGLVLTVMLSAMLIGALLFATGEHERRTI